MIVLLIALFIICLVVFFKLTWCVLGYICTFMGVAGIVSCIIILFSRVSYIKADVPVYFITSIGTLALGVLLIRSYKKFKNKSTNSEYKDNN